MLLLGVKKDVVLFHLIRRIVSAHSLYCLKAFIVLNRWRR